MRTSGTCKRRQLCEGECFVYTDGTEKGYAIIYTAGKGRPADLPVGTAGGHKWLYMNNDPGGDYGDKIIQLIPRWDHKQTDEAPKKQISDFPHRCPNRKCGAPAYIGFMSVACSKGCSA